MSDAAVTILVAGLVQVTATIAGVLALWLKTRQVGVETEKVKTKLDTNTQITKDGTAAAAENAKKAAAAAAEVKAMATETKGVLVEKLNGGIEAAVERVIGQLSARVETLEKYLHDSFHKVSDGVQATLNTTTAIAEATGIRPPPTPPMGKKT